jgi:predicted metal-dependent RNase
MATAGTSEDVSAALARVIVETIERRGVMVVPAFAVGRAQHLLYLIGKLRAEKRIPACREICALRTVTPVDRSSRSGS